MHKIYGLALAGAFIVGLTLPHTAYATFGRMCEAENPQCGTGSGTGVGGHDDGWIGGGGNAGGANPNIPAPSIPGSNCTQCDFSESHHGDCQRVAVGDWGCTYPAPENICIGKRGPLGLTCRDDSLLGGTSPGFGFGY